MNMIDEDFRNGQASYSRGVGLRTIFEQAYALNNGGREAESVSLVIGYLDGMVSSIRRIDNLLLMPHGPDK